MRPENHITDTIRSAIEEMTAGEDQHPQDPVEINSGHCRDFTVLVCEKLNNDIDVTRHDAFWVHTWLEFDGKHYDAECPTGVSNPGELPVWKRVDNHALDMAINSSSVLTGEYLTYQVNTLSSEKYAQSTSSD